MTSSYSGEAVSLIMGAAVLIFGLVLPLQGFFRLGTMRALQRRQQPIGPPALGLAVTSAVFVLAVSTWRLPGAFAIYGVLANALWLRVVTSHRSRRPRRARRWSVRRWWRSR